jgi:hypothetical protein
MWPSPGCDSFGRTADVVTGMAKSALGPGCVKSRARTKCREHNSPKLRFRMRKQRGIADRRRLRKTFCAVGERPSFHTAGVNHDQIGPEVGPAMSAIPRLRPIFAVPQIS